MSVPAGASVVQGVPVLGGRSRAWRDVGQRRDGAPGGENPSTNTLWQHSVPEDGHRPLHDDRRDTGRPPRSRKGIVSWYEPAGQPSRLRLPGTSRRDQRDPSRGGLDQQRQCHRGERAGRQRQQPPRRLDARRGVGERHASAWRNLTLFDGFDFVQVSGRPGTRGRPAAVQRLQDTRRAGRSMRTSPRGPTRPTAASSATTCRSALPPTRARPSPTASHDAVNPVDNFFNSSITARRRNVTSKVPNYREPTGLRHRRAVDPGGHDPQRSDRRGGLPGHDRRHLLLRWPGVRHADPRTEPRHHQDRQQAQCEPGDVVTYTVTVTNPQRPQGQTPTDVATNVVVSEPIPSGLDFVDFVINPPATPLPIGRSPRAATTPRDPHHCKVGLHSRPTARSPIASARA